MCWKQEYERHIHDNQIRQRSHMPDCGKPEFCNNNNTSNKEAHISDLISPHTKLLGWNGFV